jgi:hypothetical protein
MAKPIVRELQRLAPDRWFSRRRSSRPADIEPCERQSIPDRTDNQYARLGRKGGYWLNTDGGRKVTSDTVGQRRTAAIACTTERRADGNPLRGPANKWTMPKSLKVLDGGMPTLRFSTRFQMI